MNTYKPEGSITYDLQNREYISTRQGLEYAYEKQIILEAPTILCDKSFNLHVSLGPGLHGIIPRDECEFLPTGERSKDIAILTRVGKPICFKVMGLSKNEAGEIVATLSRREAQLECMLSYISTLIPGDIIPAKVTHLESFGAFVDIGCGIISLLSIDSISVSRISHPSARLEVGESIFTVVKSIDERGRIYVSRRELLGTWEENAKRFSEGQTVRGIVRSVESYGIFIELSPNLAGLAEYKDDVYKEQTAGVYIKSIIPEKMKVKLIIIDTSDSLPYKTEDIYFIDPEKQRHIDSWTYSPPGSRKLISTVF